VVTPAALSQASTDPLAELVEQAVSLAATLAAHAATARREGSRLAVLASDDRSRRFVLRFADEVLRVRDPRVALGSLRSLLADTGVPLFAGRMDALAMRVATSLGSLAPSATMAVVRRRLRAEVAAVVASADEPELSRLLARRPSSATAGDGGVCTNLHLLGEVVLGEGEAQRRTAAVAELIRRGDVDHVSVKLSGLSPKVHPYAAEHAQAQLSERLAMLLGVAVASDPPTVVTLDMERYDELRPTVGAFMEVLGRPDLLHARAGIALQAYLPDSLSVASELCTWATRRRAAGGAPVHLRLVKGANLATERTEAELRGWQAAPYPSKAEVDAAYKRVLALLLDPAWGDALEVGLASHNLFEMAWGMVLAEHLGVSGRLQLEVLAGMADPEAAAVARRVGSVLCYTPIVQGADFEAAVAYLSRRFDEAAQLGNFLHDLATGEDAGTAWARHEMAFRASVASLATVSTEPRRRQDRTLGPTPVGATPVGAVGSFDNAPDTDFSSAANRTWIRRHLLEPLPDPPPTVEDLAAVDRAVALARSGNLSWAAETVATRAALLCRAADRLEARRGELVATMVRETSKVVPEADAEVSEAVDLARWYAECTTELAALQSDGMDFAAYSCVVVAGPWNFPVSIPAGGALAALAAGSSVVLKPAPQAPRCAALVAECLWEAGFDRDVLQLLHVPDGAVGRHLVTHPGVEAVVLTGSIATARMFLDWEPTLALHAETSGKNALVLSEHADLDQAVQDLVQSAFGHAGQKCSAASLAICLGGVYDDHRFRAQLADAVSSLRVGDAADPATQVPDLLEVPGAELRRALTVLEPGEEWLVRPRCSDDSGRRWSPGVRLGVAPGSFFHLTECFGPVLGLMRAPDLDTAISWQNATDHGLTGGIHSLDLAELRQWCEQVEVGNAYVNRPTTGAVVRRQPFGGWKASSVGPTTKAGGPNAVLAMGTWRRTDGDPEVGRAARSFDRWWDREFGVHHDPSALRAEANVLRYCPLVSVVLRVGPEVPSATIEVAVGAATVVGATVEVSLDAPRPELPRALSGEAQVRVEDDGQLVARLCALRQGGEVRLRLLGALGPGHRRSLHAAGVVLDEHPVTDHGRVELLHWVREQAVSITLHRYGIVQERLRAALE
jgi:RHH-type proline utilization regulon transcriptional repressor/proline dehydrogenase/delta 1-pyrroline-5-carboxylate dehydrogenase